MNCRDFLIQLDERSPLNETAMLHLNDCAGCKKTNKRQTRIWQTIETFEAVDAPKDFDFRVKARIANAKPADFRPRRFPVLGYVLPLSLAVLVFAFVIINGVRFADQSAPQVAEIVPQNSIEKENSPKDAPPANEIAQTSSATDLPSLKPETPAANPTNTGQSASKKQAKEFSDVQLAAVKFGSKLQPATRKTIIKEEFKGSHDFDVSPQKVNILPKGISSDKRVETLPDVGNGNSVSTEQVLTTLGMETVFEKGIHRVKLIKPNSIAERSGVKVGDVIESIDGKKLTDESFRGKTIEGKKLTVARGAEKLEVILH